MSFLNKLFRSPSSKILDEAKDGDWARVRALVRRQPQLVSSQDENGLTPLHPAADSGRESVTAFLVANKAEANTKDNRGATPLHLAAYHNHKGLVELPLANQADVNPKDNNGSRPLQNASLPNCL